MPFRRRVLTMNSRARCCAGEGSSGRSTMDRSSGSPGTTAQWSKYERPNAWPCVWNRRSVSNPKDSIAGSSALTVYTGVPGLGASATTCPRRFDSTLYTADMQSAGVWISTAKTGSIRRGEANKKALYAARRAVGIICPPPRAAGASATTASRSLNLTSRMGSSHSGPSRVPHWNPCTTLSLTAPSRALSTSPGRVSSSKTFAPNASGPKAHTERAARMSQSYLFWKKSPSRFFGHARSTAPFSMSRAKPLSRGSAIIVSLFFLFGVSAKHLSEDVSTTVSANVTTGSATFTSTSEYSSLRSFITESRNISPVPKIVCSPLSSTLVTAAG
mmetsp:Transcript_2622/g.10944  ORF Transcript_2622/g.10944 Transcript_2622/m.10944 type:complete len:330 (+) Transcript_2622:745-1734(+)